MNIVKVATKGSNKNLAVIGTLPGYNSIIDTNNRDLEKDLLHNISFIDFYLATYNVGGKSNQSLISFFKSMTKKLVSDTNFYDYKLLNEKNDIKKNFNKLIKKYIATDKEIDGMRIVAASDSMATETISNNFGDSMLYQFANNSSLVKAFGKFNVIENGLKELSYTQAWKMFNNASKHTNIIGSIFSGAALGVKISLPKFFESSSYTHNLSIFFKLTAPSGAKEVIDELIFKPLKAILIFSSPNSFNGLTYAFPFLYRIIAYGNTFISLGFISDITISRGSMETVYSDELYPLSIDVRLNVRTISENFANIIKGTISEDFNNIGIASPALTSAIDINNDAGFTSPEIITIKL